MILKRHAVSVWLENATLIYAYYKWLCLHAVLNQQLGKFSCLHFHCLYIIFVLWPTMKIGSPTISWKKGLTMKRPSWDENNSLLSSPIVWKDKTNIKLCGDVNSPSVRRYKFQINCGLGPITEIINTYFHETNPHQIDNWTRKGCLHSLSLTRYNSRHLDTNFFFKIFMKPGKIYAMAFQKQQCAHLTTVFTS